MLKRLTVVSVAPVLIILFMLFLVHLQPLGRMGLISTDGARTGRLVLDLLPYGLAVLGLGIGFRFRSCGVMIAMLALASAYLALKLDGGGGTGLALLHRDLRHSLPTLLATTGLLAAWAENVSWRTRRGCWALLLSLAVLFVFWGHKLHLFGMPPGLGAWFAFLGQQLNAILGPFLAFLAEGSGISAPLTIEFGAGMVVGPVAFFVLLRAVQTRSPLLAGLGGSLVITAPQMVRWAGNLPLGLIYTAAALMILVGVLESVHKRAYRDALTDLPGRRSLDDTLRHPGRRYAIAMLDVDHFKRFNDRYGHDAGDEVLKMIAARTVRIRGGQPFRFGGEEFAVVFSGRAAVGAAEALEDFRRQLAQTPFVIRKRPRPQNPRRKGRSARSLTSGTRPKVKVTVSIGLAHAAGRKSKAVDVLKAADKALYKAKRRGRNRVCGAT